MNCAEKPFGVLPTQETVWRYSLDNGCGITAEIISYGAIIQKLFVPDRNGHPSDILLGQDTLEDYIRNPSCSAAVIGRCANRISNASFAIGGQAYTLDRNFGGDTLHSGSGNYGGKNFKGTLFEEETRVGVRLCYTDTGIGGFPGKVEVQVTYSLDKDGTFTIQYDALPEQETILNITNHAYFNLAGHDSGSVGDQLLKLDADFYLPNDRRGMPTGEVINLHNTDMDFTQFRPIKQGFGSTNPQIAQYGGYDHNYCLRGHGYRKIGEAQDPASGRGMSVMTDLPGVQLYTANHFPDPCTGKNGAVYHRNDAFCLETQHYPNAINMSQFPSPLYPGNQPFRSVTAFRFYTTK